MEFAASLHMMADGGQLDVSRGVNCRVTHEPLGVVAGIVPFNFPVMVPLWMAPNAIVAGNAFILKPSEVVPYGAMKLASLWQEAGLPDGILVRGTFHPVRRSRKTSPASVRRGHVAWF